MSAANLLSRLRDAGLQVTANGDSLIIGPRALITAELRAAIQANKVELLAQLPRYRWRVTSPSGETNEVCCLPEMTAAELQDRYPGRRLVPLPALAEIDPINFGAGIDV
jgi:TubC N-terminal docking domain